MLKNYSIRLYNSLFDFVAKDALISKQIERGDVHAILITVLTTSWMMWFYTILAYYEMRPPYPYYLGVTLSIIHMFSPLLLRITKNTFFIATIILGSGVLHQFIYTYYSGGFFSDVIVWISIPPLFGGLLLGQTGAIIWSGISLLYIAYFFIQHLQQFQFPNLLAVEGHILAHGATAFCWVFLSTIFIICFVKMNALTIRQQKEQNKKIDDLFRVLFHDLANPLGRIGIGLNICKKQNNPIQTQRGLDIASQAADSMIEITQNVRKIYAVSKGKVEIPLSFYDLNEAIEYIIKIFSAETENKQIKINYDFNKCANVKLLVEPISFKNQVLANIISNSVKFSPNGTAIDIQVIQRDSSKVVLEIKDQGIGMSEALISNLFDITKKTTRKGTDGETGTGFGMHIMKSFVEMYQGEIEVFSKDIKEHSDSGTTFRLILRGSV
ncbi:MAG: sensor histidine kinase [Bacteriovoracaceae bacterium]